MILFRFWMLICLVVYTFGTTCKEGERISRKRNGQCEPCPENSFQNGPNASQQCQPCTKCKVDSGSEVMTNCSKTSDAICKCRSGFIKRDSASSICKCPEGSGLDQSGKICRSCPQGSFTAGHNSICVQWKRCRSGEKIPGNKTSDVICNDDPESNGTKLPPIHPTSPKAFPQTESTMTTPHHTAASVTPVIISEGPKDPKSSNYENVMTLIGVVLLLTVLLTAVTCKLIIIPCIKENKKPTIITAQESLCGRPVEESGDSSLSYLVKPPTLEEP